jgi:hypothetical protein
MGLLGSVEGDEEGGLDEVALNTRGEYIFYVYIQRGFITDIYIPHLSTLKCVSNPH